MKGEIEFTENINQTVTASLVFDEGDTPDITELFVYAAYRDTETGALIGVTPLTISRNITVTFDISENSDITLYVWDKYMRPRMEPKTYKTEAGAIE